MTLEKETQPAQDKVATSVVLAPRIITNQDLEQYFDAVGEKTSGGGKILAERIYTTTGVRIRRYMNEDETIQEYAIKAAQDALQKRGWQGNQLDRIYVCYSYGYNQKISDVVASALNANNCLTRDVCAACSGVTVATDHFAKSSSGNERVLFVAVDKYHDNLSEKGSHSRHRRLFSDGASSFAGIIGPTEDADMQILATNFIHIPSDAIRMPICEEAIPRDSLVIHVPNSVKVFEMDGDRVMEILRSPKIVQETKYIHRYTNSNQHFKAVDIPHQASAPVIQERRRQFAEMGLDVEVSSRTLENYGNMAAASVLAEFDAALQKIEHPESKIFFLSGYGAGMVYSTAAIRIKPSIS